MTFFGALLCAHYLHVLSNSVTGVELVGHVRVVLPGHSLADGGLHQSTQRGQHVDGRVDLAVVQLTVNVDLTWKKDFFFASVTI